MPPYLSLYSQGAHTYSSKNDTSCNSCSSSNGLFSPTSRNRSSVASPSSTDSKRDDEDVLSAHSNDLQFDFDDISFSPKSASRMDAATSSDENIKDWETYHQIKTRIGTDESDAKKYFLKVLSSPLNATIIAKILREITSDHIDLDEQGYIKTIEAIFEADDIGNARKAFDLYARRSQESIQKHLVLPQASGKLGQASYLLSEIKCYGLSKAVACLLMDWYIRHHKITTPIKVSTGQAGDLQALSLAQNIKIFLLDQHDSIEIIDDISNRSRSSSSTNSESSFILKGIIRRRASSATSIPIPIQSPHSQKKPGSSSSSKKKPFGL